MGYTVFLVVAMLLTAVAFRRGMRVYENDPISFLQAIQFAVELFTTAGFGGYSPWESAEMNLFVAVMNVVGMGLLFGALPVLATPFLQNAFSTTVPRTADGSITGHVVICSYTARAEALIAELDALDVPYVVVEQDREQAAELYEAGHRVIRRDPESVAGLEAARLSEARALIADVSDEVDASIVLAAKEVAEDVQVLSVVEEPAAARYHELAGADRVLSPRPLLGESLAAKVTTALTTEIDEAIRIDDDLELAEVPVRHGSQLAGVRLADSAIREEAGVNVIGAWFRGEFDASPSPAATLDPGTVLLVSGRHDQLERLVELTRANVRSFTTGETVVVGHGEVGQTVTNALDDAEITYTTVDREDGPGVDVVGDATEPATLAEAGVAEARTVVLALPDDTITEFATLVIRDMAPETEIVARVEEAASIPKMYRAGADYVLSLATVTGRMSASRILEDRDVLSLDQQVEVIRTTAPGLAGRRLADADVRGQTGCTVVAVERDGRVMTAVGADTEIEAGDEVIVVGTDEGVRRFRESFGSD
ncbi:MAG: TrkA family potassium uptake protein [Halobaculum sp.]